MIDSFTKYKNLYLGFSGGADSTALALLLLDNKQSFEAVHFHHHLRQSADHDALFCKNFCEVHGIVFTLVDIPVNQLKNSNESIESAARRLRMEYWESRAHEEDSAVLLAHHKDDIAENFLLRSMRGSSASGLSGLRKERKLNGITYLRPLLDMSKDEIMSFLQDRNASWCEDESNAENIYSRNIIRNKVIPTLQETAALEGLYRTTENIETDALFIEEQAQKWIEENSLSTESYMKLHPALKPRVLRIFVQKNTGKDFIPGHDAIQRLNEEASRKHKENALVPLGNGIELTLAVNGDIFIEADSYEFCWEWQKESSIELQNGRLFISDSKTECSEEFLKSDLEDKLLIRNWQNGDKMIPFSHKSRKKVKDLFSDRKTPQQLRKQLPLVFSGESIIWIPKVKRAEFGRCESNQESVIIAYEQV